MANMNNDMGSSEGGVGVHLLSIEFAFHGLSMLY